MKTRQGFVTNSSSTSYLVKVGSKEAVLAKLLDVVEKFYEEYGIPEEGTKELWLKTNHDYWSSGWGTDLRLAEFLNQVQEEKGELVEIRHVPL